MNDKKQGIIYIIMAGFFFALMTFFVRMSGDLPTMQKAFFRNAVAAVAAVILLAKSDEGFKIKKDSWKGLFLRSFFGTTGLICNFYAVDHLPFGLATTEKSGLKISPRSRRMQSACMSTAAAAR